MAQKANEANDLRNQNRQLAAENGRLTDLTRMLLSHSAFADFVNDIAVNGMPRGQASAQPTEQANNSISSHPVQVPATMPPSQQHSFGSTDQFIGTTMIPEPTIDFSSLPVSDGWSNGMDFSSFHNPQIYAVRIPQGPAIDTDALSGKPSCKGPSNRREDNHKNMAPHLQSGPTFHKNDTLPATVVPNPEIQYDESEPSFALFNDAPPSKPYSPCLPAGMPQDMFGGVAPEKIFSRFELVIPEREEALAARLVALYSQLEASSSRIERLLPIS